MMVSIAKFQESYSAGILVALIHKSFRIIKERRTVSLSWKTIGKVSLKNK